MSRPSHTPLKLPAAILAGSLAACTAACDDTDDDLQAALSEMQDFRMFAGDGYDPTIGMIGEVVPNPGTKVRSRPSAHDGRILAQLRAGSRVRLLGIGSGGSYRKGWTLQEYRHAGDRIGLTDDSMLPPEDCTSDPTIAEHCKDTWYLVAALGGSVEDPPAGPRIQLTEDLLPAGVDLADYGEIWLGTGVESLAEASGANIQVGYVASAMLRLPEVDTTAGSHYCEPGYVLAADVVSAPRDDSGRDIAINRHSIAFDTLNQLDDGAWVDGSMQRITCSHNDAAAEAGLAPDSKVLVESVRIEPDLRPRYNARYPYGAECDDDATALLDGPGGTSIAYDANVHDWDDAEFAANYSEWTVGADIEMDVMAHYAHAELAASDLSLGAALPEVELSEPGDSGYSAGFFLSPWACVELAD